MSDRFEQIKLAYPTPCGFPTIDWLISEVERLRIELMGQFGAYRMAADDATEKKTTITTLREVLACDVEQLYEAADRGNDRHISEILRCHAGVMAIRHKALATAQEDKGVC